MTSKKTLEPRQDKKSRDERSWLGRLGPGLITGVSDDDPSGIATYSQAGARFGYGMLWTMIFSFPLMTAIQMMCARIGRVTGKGIAHNIRKHSGAKLLYPVVFLLLIVNTINIAADLLAMGDALRLLIGGSTLLFCFVFGVVSIFLQVFIPYTKYVKFLRVLTLSLLAYVATALTAKIEWKQALLAAVIPRLRFNASTFQAVTAIIGTTISPYLFFWQASQEVEETRCRSEEKPLLKERAQAPRQLSRIQWDTLIGMGVSNLIAFFIILTTASTLHAHGKTEIETAAQAAEAIRPFAGSFTFFLFSLGIIGTGLLAIPVLAGSAAYAIGETFGWKVGLENKPSVAKFFYGVITASIIAGIGLDFIKVNPMRALIGAAILNGVMAVPITAIIVLMASRKKIMGEFTAPRALLVLGWLTFAVMLASAAGMFVK